jgi:hypothetical protein
MMFLLSWILFSLIMARCLEPSIESFVASSNASLLTDSLQPEQYNPELSTRILNSSSKVVFPSSDNNQISTNSANDIWWHYPVFKVGSFAQITNNLKYPNNPDEGTCMPASMCNTLYLNKKSFNEICPLPPVSNTTNDTTRVNYYLTGVI